MSDGVGTQAIVRPCSLTYVARARTLGCFRRTAGYPRTNHQSDGGRGPRNPDRRLQDKGRGVRSDGRGEAGRKINAPARGAANGRSLRDATTHCTDTASRDVREAST
jgi:hypothetical protein